MEGTHTRGNSENVCDCGSLELLRKDHGGNRPKVQSRNDFNRLPVLRGRLYDRLLLYLYLQFREFLRRSLGNPVVDAGF